MGTGQSRTDLWSCRTDCWVKRPQTFYRVHSELKRVRKTHSDTEAEANQVRRQHRHRISTAEASRRSTLD